MRSLIALIVAIACTQVGCSNCRTPFNTAPGTYKQQRFEAVAHDPYPEDDLGPECVGGRPRDYQKPLAEPVRNRMYPERKYWFQRW